MFVLVLFGALAFLVLGNYHVVSGAPGGMVQRRHFGFQDAFASIDVCTSGPWIVAVATHPVLCTDLQAAGILESDEAREARGRQELERQMREAQREAEKQTKEMMRRLGQ